MGVTHNGDAYNRNGDNGTWVDSNTRLDFQLLGENSNDGEKPGVNVPEPSTWILGFFGTILITYKKKRR